MKCSCYSTLKLIIYCPAIITEHCTKIVTVSLWTFPLAIASTTLLFFFRVRAVFDRNKLVVAFFAFMWIAVLAANLTGPWGIVGTKVGSTNYCMITHVEPYVASASIITLVNDTFVFLAITWKLMRHAHVQNSIRTGIRVLAFGEYMPTLSKALLQDGQAYYLYVLTVSTPMCVHFSIIYFLSQFRTTVTTALMTVIMMYIRTVPAVYNIVLAMPNMMLMNMMASRVFRNTKFGRYRQSLVATGATVFKSTNKRPSSTAPIPLESFQLKNRDDETKETQSTMPIEVKILVESQEEKSLDEKPKYSGPSLGHAEGQR